MEAKEPARKSALLWKKVKEVHGKLEQQSTEPRSVDNDAQESSSHWVTSMAENVSNAFKAPVSRKLSRLKELTRLVIPNMMIPESSVQVFDRLEEKENEPASFRPKTGIDIKDFVNAEYFKVCIWC